MSAEPLYDAGPSFKPRAFSRPPRDVHPSYGSRQSVTRSPGFGADGQAAAPPRARICAGRGRARDRDIHVCATQAPLRRSLAVHCGVECQWQIQRYNSLIKPRTIQIQNSIFHEYIVVWVPGTVPSLAYTK
jgi:hypothetical protein